jgi:hypothetical protein
MRRHVTLMVEDLTITSLRYRAVTPQCVGLVPSSLDPAPMGLVGRAAEEKMITD